MPTPAISLEFVAGVAYTGDVLATIILEVVLAIDVVMLADEIVIVLATVMIPSEFTLPAPRGDSMPFCWAAFACRPTAELDRVHALQACMPSCHVC